MPGAASGKYIEVFFLSENTNQYFVHPIEWKEGDLNLSIDFTVRAHKKHNLPTLSPSAILLNKIPPLMMNWCFISSSMTLLRLHRLW